MFLNLLFSLFLTQNNTNEVLGDRGCGLGSQDIFFVNSQNDFNEIQNCSTLNGSLFVNGDYNINSLSLFSNINNIEGYLVIYDSHTLRNLKGLQNLENIHATNPYLLQYGVAIKYNNNPNDNTSGLCFANQVNWTKITNQNVVVSNNRIYCPDCHNECVGCFGPGVLLCQDCLNYRSGNACVETCPGGTVVSDNFCFESLPTNQVSLEFTRQDDEYNISITWNEPDEPNGFVLGYTLYRDSSEIYRTFYDDSGYTVNELDLSYMDQVPILDTNYSYSISYYNSEGSLEGDAVNYFVYNRIPHQIENLHVDFVGNISSNISWIYQDSALVPSFEYSLNGGHFILISNFIKNGTKYTFTLGDLQPYYSYDFIVRPRYETVGDIERIHFITDIGIPPVPDIPILEQDLVDWVEVSGYRGPIRYYLLYMNDTVIYNGSYLQNGYNINGLVVGGNWYSFKIAAFTRWDLMSESDSSLNYFIDFTTTITPDTTTNYTNVHNSWDDWIWYVIIICSSLIGILLLVLLYVCYCRKKPNQQLPTRPAIYNTMYEPVNVSRNNIRVDEIDSSRTHKNQTYRTVEPAEENEVYGFNEEDTNSVEYLQIIDSVPVIPPPPVLDNVPRRRKSEVQSIELNDNLKNDKNYQNTAKRKMSLLDELKMKIPEMIPKNMLNE